MKLAEALKTEALQRARVVAGAANLDQELRWVHVVDLPNPLPWVREGMLLLTTGYAWPRDEEGQRALVRGLAGKRLAGIGLAVPQFFEHFSPATRDEADRAGLPLIEIPWAIPFAQITEEVQRAILDKQYSVIQQSELIHRELTRAALGAASLQDLAGALGQLIGRAVTFEDHEGKVLASYSLHGMEDRVREDTLALGHATPEYSAYLESLGYITRIQASSEPIRIPGVTESGIAGRVVCPIRIRHELVGLVWIIEGESPLSELDLRAAEHAATVAALHIAHQRELGTLEARLGYTFLDSLLEGRFEPTPQALERAQLLEFDPQRSYCVGILVLHVPLPLSREGFLRREQLAARVARRLQELGYPPLISMSLNQVPFLLPEGGDVAQVWTGLAESDLSLTVSRPRPGAEGVRQGYVEAGAVVPLLQPGQLRRYDEMLLPRVLSGDVLARQSFLDDLLDPLHKARNGATLVQTLLAFTQCGFYVQRAAQELHIHPKTLQYRLGRAAELARLDFHDPETRFRLQLASHLLSMTDKPQG